MAFGSICLPFMNAVGAQYGAVSLDGRQVVLLDRSSLTVENASADTFPKKSCKCEAPGWPGNTIGSSGRVCVYLQRTTNCPTAPAASALNGGVTREATTRVPTTTAAMTPIRRERSTADAGRGTRFTAAHPSRHLAGQGRPQRKRAHGSSQPLAVWARCLLQRTRSVLRLPGGERHG